MRSRTVGWIAGAVALVAATAGPAAALDVGGDWEGTARCVLYTPGGKVKQSVDWEMRITQVGTELRAELAGVRMAGVVIEAAKPSEGTVALLSCNASPGPLGFAVIQGTAKVNASTQRLKLEAFEADASGLAGVCTAKLERSGPIAVPAVPPCE